jgi:hypothetical protein
MVLVLGPHACAIWRLMKALRVLVSEDDALIATLLAKLLGSIVGAGKVRSGR